MKLILNALLLSVAACSLAAHAADPACEAKAADKKLAGAAKASFLKKCERDAPAAVANPASAPTATLGGACESQALDKKLAGAAKTSYLKKCEKDAKAAAASSSCESRAAEKKLAGAAKTSFLKKCVSDAAAS